MSLTCMFCTDDIIKSYSSLKNHLIKKHMIMKFQQLLVAFFLLDQPEIDEMFSMLQPRIDKFKAKNSKNKDKPKVEIKNERNVEKINYTIEKNNFELIILDDNDESKKIKTEDK